LLVIGLLLAGAVAWLLERISQVPKNPHQHSDLRIYRGSLVPVT
jgi:hypothetical protein